MIYFDNSATSKYKPPCVKAAVLRELCDSANGGRASHKDALKSAMLIYETRQSLTDYLGGKGYKVIFTSGCTESLNLAIFGTLRNAFGKNVIVTAYEHNSVLRPLYRLQRMGVITLNVLYPNENGDITTAQFENAINGNTAMLAVNHVSNVTGKTQDVASICELGRRYGITTLVDGAQSIGEVPINVRELGVDMLAGTAHKALNGMQGVGFLLIAPEVKLSPIKYGGTGLDSALTNPPITVPESYEAGTPCTPAIAALNSAIKWHGGEDFKIRRKIETLSEQIISALSEQENITLYTSERTGVIAFNVASLPSSKVGEILNEKGIAVRCGLHCAPLVHKHYGTLTRGMVRVSVGLNNTQREAATLLKEVAKIAREYK